MLVLQTIDRLSIVLPVSTDRLIWHLRSALSCHLDCAFELQPILLLLVSVLQVIFNRAADLEEYSPSIEILL